MFRMSALTGDLFSYSRTFASNEYRRPLASSALTKSAYAFLSDRFLLARGVPVGRHVHAANPSPTTHSTWNFSSPLKRAWPRGQVYDRSLITKVSAKQGTATAKVRESSGKACVFLFPSIFMAQACYNFLVLGPCDRFLGCLTSIDLHSSHVMDCSAAMRLPCGGGPASVSFPGGPKWAKSCTWAI